MKSNTADPQNFHSPYLSVCDVDAQLDFCEAEELGVSAFELPFFFSIRVYPS